VEFDWLRRASCRSRNYGGLQVGLFVQSRRRGGTYFGSPYGKANTAVVGAVLALAGVAFLELGGMDSSALALSLGDIASLIQPLAFGMGFWRTEKAMQKFPEHANRSTAAQLMAVFMVSTLYAVITEPSGMFDVHQLQLWLSDPMILASLFWTGVITTALTVYMETIALKTLSAAATTLIFSTEPLWGTAFAATVLGEQLGPAAAAGAFFILSGCVYSNLGFAGIQSFLFPDKGEEKDEADLSLLHLEVNEDDIAKASSASTSSSDMPPANLQDVMEKLLPFSDN
jgi:hypothetical protein